MDHPLWERALRILLPRERWIRRKIRDVHAEYQPRIDAARSHEERGSLTADRDADLYEWRHELVHRRTQRLRRIGRRHHVREPPLPEPEEENDFWTSQYGRHTFTATGEADMGRQIRDARMAWMRLAVMAVGGVAALIGALKYL